MLLILLALLSATTSAEGQSPSPSTRSWVADLAWRDAVATDRPYLPGDGKAVLPNLLVWIAKSSFEAGNYEKSEGTARELMELVDDARARFGDKFDWPERGAKFWKRARSASADDEAASELVDAHSQHSYRKHWAQTVLGLLACRNGDVDRAVLHLRESANVRPEHRLSSYGPSLDLVREVCARGRWDEGLKYLRVWEDAWDHPRLREWIAAVEERRLPSSEESA
jgi:hypothetical protein